MGAGRQEMDGSKCCEHNEAIPPSGGSSIAGLQRGIPAAWPQLARAIAQVCGCHGDKRGLIKTQ